MALMGGGRRRTPDVKDRTTRLTQSGCVVGRLPSGRVRVLKLLVSVHQIRRDDLRFPSLAHLYKPLSSRLHSAGPRWKADVPNIFSGWKAEVEIKMAKRRLSKISHRSQTTGRSEASDLRKIIRVVLNEIQGESMSIERRTKLLDGLMEGQPGLRQIVTNRASLLEGNWDLTAFAHQQGFEALWDHAVTRPAGLAVLPLLMLWHQSVELTIKAAINGTTGCQPPGHHRLTDLFDFLLRVRKEHGRLEADDDAYTASVRRLVVEFQKLDERADRWRYPTDLKGKAHRGVSVDLDRLYQAHAMITGWCDWASVEAEQHHLHLSGGC